MVQNKGNFNIPELSASNKILSIILPHTMQVRPFLLYVSFLQPCFLQRCFYAT